MSSANAYTNYYYAQSGGQIPYFSGPRYQRGYGILGSLFRMAMPLLTKGAKTLGKTALKTGAQVVGDVLSGDKLSHAMKNRSGAAIGKLVRRINTDTPVKRNLSRKRAVKRRRSLPPGKKNRKLSKDIFY